MKNKDTKDVYQQLIEEYTKTIELDPDCAEAYNKRGVSYYNSGMYDKAIEDCSKAIELDSQLASAYDNRGVSYYRKEMYKEAIEDYTKAVEVNPEYNNAYYNVACIYSLQEDKENALKNLEKSLEAGFINFKHLEEDSDLDFIRETSKYEELVKHHKNQLKLEREKSQTGKYRIGFY